MFADHCNTLENKGEKIEKVLNRGRNNCKRGKGEKGREKEKRAGVQSFF